MPFRNGTFDLVVAFEVIEHLTDWQALLRESRRVLRDDGLMIVSTPNRAYYTESRGTEGPNPYHVHEFEFTEFREALLEFFPQVSILLQNRVECFAFTNRGGRADASVASGGAPEEANFFIAVCGVHAAQTLSDFVYVPRAANLLRERERHIRKLEAELAQTKTWLDEQIQAQVELQRKHESLTLHLEQQNRWARELEANWTAAQKRVVQLQDELKVLQETADRRIQELEGDVVRLEAENRANVQWATELDTRLAERAEQLAATVRLLDVAEGNVIERTQWAQRLDGELAEVRAQLAMVRQSRWVKLGRGVGVGPKL
jgi:SAM-dependent methyltransferase